QRRIRWDCFDCQIHPQYGDLVKCHVSGSRRSLLNVDVNTLEELDLIRVYVKISTRFRKTDMYRKFFDITFDGCRVIADMTPGTMVTNMFNAIVKSSNQPRKCPIKTGSIYYRNISIEDALPLFVPTSELLVQTNLFSKRKLYLNATVRGEITE
ncbi:hypothetical protein KR009_002571, partial [Drosophila setifemur]